MTGQRFRTGGLALATGTVVACGTTASAHSLGTTNSYPASTLDRAPRVIRCDDAVGPTASQISGVHWDLVTLQFTVLADGNVDPTTIETRQTRATPGGGPAASASVSEAKQRALSCQYEPGLMKDTPVAATTSRRFRIAVMP